MADVDINKFRASVVRDGSKPSSPGFVVSEGQDPVDPAGSGQNHLPVTIAAAATGLSITESQVLGGAGTTSQYLRGDGSLDTFPDLTGYVPYTGAHQTVNLNTQQLQAGHTTLTTNGSTETLTINHTSGSGKAINVTKGGAGEGLYVNKTSGSGNAATIVGTLEATTLVKTGGTSSQFLKADGSVDSTSYQPLLTNPVTGTGTTNYLPKFTGASTIGNSNIQDSGSLVSVGVTSTFASNINVTNNVLINLGTASTASTGGTLWLTTNNNTSRAAAIQAITQTTDNAHDLLFYTNSTFDTPKERLRIFSDGNVFIGPTASNNGARLQVSGTATISSSVTLSGTNSQLLQTPSNSIAGDNAAVFFNSNANSYGIYIGAGSGTNHALYITDSTRTKDLFKVQGNGNVGIGTPSPSALLHIQAAEPTLRITDSNDGGVMFIGNTGGFSYIRAFSRDFRFLNAVGTSLLGVNANGNVLIGTTTDASGKLQVLGADNAIISQIKSASGMVQIYPYFSAYGGPIIQALDGGAVGYVPLRIECTTMTVSGNQTVTGTKSFAIDHPLDNTKTLLHYSTESPKADLIYRGKINLVNGKAIINIDLSSKMTEGTFVSLCRDIQCFTTNENGWDLVKGKVVGNILTIESNNPNSNSEISWMVIGERNDNSIKKSNMLDKDGNLIVEKNKN